MKLRNFNILIFTFTIVANIIAGIVFGFYNSRTSFVAEIILPESNDIVVEALTPNDNIVTCNSNNSDTIHFRPLKSITIKVGENKYIIRSNQELLLCKAKLSEYGIYVNSYSKKTLATINWILSFKALKYSIIGFYLILFFCLLLINKTRIIKYYTYLKHRLFRFLLTGKRIKYKNIDTINKKFIFIFIGFLILYLVFTISKIKDSPLNHNSMEPRRALVAMEMKLSGDYINPTRASAEYLNKPAAGHYMLIPFVDSKNNPEFKMRLISFCFLIITSFVIFWGIKSTYKRNDLSIITAIAFLFNYYMLSIWILKIDYPLALVIVSMFFTTYYFGIKKKYLLMFVFLSLFGFIGFFIKGFLALYFMIVATIAILAINKDLKLIFSKINIICVLIIVAVLGVLLIVLKKSDFIIQQVIELNNYSSYDIGYRLKHLFGFWGLISVSLSPLLIMLPVIFLRKNILQILKDKFLSYSVLIIFLGTFPFWLSPQFLLHYIIMFIPFLLFIVIYFVLQNEKYEFKDKLIITIGAIVLAFSFLINNWSNLENFLFLILSLSLSLVIIYLPLKYRLLYIYSLLVLAFIFSFFALRKENFHSERFVEEQSKKDCKRISHIISNKKIALYNEKSNYQDAVIYYLEYFTNELINTSSNANRNSFDYLLADINQIEPQHKLIDSIVQFSYRFEQQNRKISMEKDYLYLIDNKEITTDIVDRVYKEKKN